MHEAPFAVVAIATGRLGAEVGDEGVKLGEAFFAHAQRGAKAVKPLVDEILIVVRYHLLRLLIQCFSRESLDLQQERFA